MVERLHRLLLDVVKDEFERLGIIDINSVQALLLFNIGDNEVTAGELKTRGYYQGSNVSYNLKKLVEYGYMHHQKCDVDRRAVRVRLTEKGHADPQHRRGRCSSGTPPASSAARCSATCGSRTSTPACGGWSATGPTRSATSTEAEAAVATEPVRCCDVSATVAAFPRASAAQPPRNMIRSRKTRTSASLIRRQVVRAGLVSKGSIGGSDGQRGARHRRGGLRPLRVLARRRAEGRACDARQDPARHPARPPDQGGLHRRDRGREARGLPEPELHRRLRPVLRPLPRHGPRRGVPALLPRERLHRQGRRRRPRRAEAGRRRARRPAAASSRRSPGSTAGCRRCRSRRSARCSSWSG